MSNLAWLADKLSRRRIARETSQHLATLAQGPTHASRHLANGLLRQLRAHPGPKVTLGETAWGEPVIIPLVELIKSCSVLTGGMGSGKTMAACLILDALIACLPELRSMAFGLIDPKGELFDRALYLLAVRLKSLDEEAREELLKRIVVIDFSARQAVSSYNILSRWPYAEPDYFVTSRLETLRELLPSGDKLSLRGGEVLKNVLALLAEFGLPLTYLTQVLEAEPFRSRLLSRSKNPEVKLYFGHHFAQEGRTTVAALRARMESLFASEGVRMALAGPTAPDFTRLQNEGKLVLVNLSGPSITRGVRLLLQGLILSDVRASIFARPNNPPVTYLWIADEAQNFFRTKQQQDDMTDVLTMARSFGSFFSFLCQNLTTAIPDTRILETLHTNIKLSLTLRGTPRDAQFLRAALPVTGRRPRPDSNPFRERSFYSPEEERALLLEGIAHLPDRTGYFWLKTRSPEALKIQTRGLNLPEGEAFREAVDALREEPRLGGRLSRQEYERVIEERDREWREPQEESTLPDRFEKKYQEERSAWQA
ncbi:MAG: hypothetical protein EPN47_13820 [Acidobacteria bacterium]|nr:MAG: hypothetical protein EPN47_13820 [Acidobacteriota bacterium]